MHYAKIDFLIVTISIITLRFVASTVLIANILETKPASEPKLLQKL